MNDATLKTQTVPELRVYPILDAEGKTRYVLAKKADDAVIRVYHPKIGRPLTGAQVVDLHAQGIEIERVVYLPPKPKAQQNPAEPPGKPADVPVLGDTQKRRRHATE